MADSPRDHPQDLPLFRAPPPSPAAIPRNMTLDPQEDDDFSNFLKRSRRVPELILPHRNPPLIDWESLISQARGGSKEEILRSAARSMGCFQIINHGIEEEIIEGAIEAAEGVFGMPLERKKEATRSPDRRWGFELEEEEAVGERDEFFWWNGGAQQLAGVQAQDYDYFSIKIEGLLSKIENIARKIMHVLINSSEQSNTKSFLVRKEVHDFVICLRKHRLSAFNQNQEMLGALIRSLDSPHALGIHICNGAYRFHVYSKRALFSFRPMMAAIVITIGDQTQARSGGMYKQVIGKPEYQYGEARREPISLAFLHHYAAGHPQEEQKIISISQQLLMAACLLFFYHMIAHLCFSKS